MITSKRPIIVEIQEEPNFVDNLEEQIKRITGDKNSLILNYPSVYIHKWNGKDDGDKTLYDIYIGESNDIIQRTKEHLKRSNEKDKWQKHLIKDEDKPSMFIIGHPHFNKSLTLDIENRLIHYAMGMNTIRKIHNARGNPQNDYYSANELDSIFDKVWDSLRFKNKNLFVSKEEIRDSAIFKASPFHKLNKQQLDAKNKIIAKINEAMKSKKSGQLIFVNGEAGTGKTVLISSTFYDVVCKQIESLGRGNVSCALIVNHNEQLVVYEEMVKKLGLNSECQEELVYKPTRFINKHSPTNPIDIAFIDEGHLLLTQKGRAYGGTNQLDDIIKMSKIVVCVYDENQVLTSEEMWEQEKLQEKKNISI